ncbi:SCO family protein [Natrononativus amylolyticus]|uniref:SCO family protein n=1 Tax=Natrononativus amylolyticus TaxID=2963434 RepID=UPI0020CF463A|nr:SCO family protein [Natrononativus amylolyticus]
MERRTYLGALGSAGIASVAGCLDSDPIFGSGEGGASDEAAEGTVLGPPEQSTEGASHPSYGEEIPSFSVPDPLAETDVSSDDLQGERAYLMTFFFTSCPDGACPALLLRLRRAHEDSLERGTEDETAFLALTFDPERDTPEELETYADQQGVNLEAGNFHFLRPESYDAGMELVTDDFGMPVERVDTDEHPATADDAGDDSSNGATDDSNADDDSSDHADDDSSDHADDDSSDHADDHGHDDDSHSDENDDHVENDSHADHDHGEYTFTHYNLILLVNERGIVERAYPQATGTDIEPIVEDFRTVVDG